MARNNDSCYCGDEMILLAQVPTEVPQTLDALLWIIVIALGGAVATLFWQLQKEKDRRATDAVALVEKTTLALVGVDGSLEDVVAILSELDKDLKLQAQIQAIRDALAERNGK